MTLIGDKGNLLERGILSALAFYDLFDYPLTLLELSRFMQDDSGKLSDSKFSLSDIVEVLKFRDSLKRKVSCRRGFYMLAGREELAAKRLRRHNQALKRWRKMIRVVRLLRSVPFLKMVAACNMFPIDTPSPESDIDLVIVTKHGRIWLVRLIVTVLVALTGQWRHQKRIAGKLCLSFFLSDQHLNLQQLYQEKKVWYKKDPYLANWVVLVAPVFDRDGTAENFWQANQWAREFLPNSYPYRPVPLRKIEAGWLARGWRGFWEAALALGLGDWVEKTVKYWQLEYMKSVGDEEWLNNPNVVRSDEMLKFHEIDRREHFREEFAENLAKAYH